MKLPKSLMIAGCAVLFASLFSGCGKQLNEEQLVTNYNCLSHLQLLTAKFPDFTKKCQEKKLGVYSDTYNEYLEASKWSIDLFDGRIEKKKALKAQMQEWANDPNTLSQEDYDMLRKEYPKVNREVVW